jgi:hypothetical protein
LNIIRSKGKVYPVHNIRWADCGYGGGEKYDEVEGPGGGGKGTPSCT